MNETFIQVRENDVTKLFRSIPFRESLGQAAAFTKRTGYESGFLVVRDAHSGSYYISRMCMGKTNSFKVEGITFEESFNFGDQNVSSDHCYRFLDLHFHPDISGYPKPSYLDLQLVQEDRVHFDGDKYEHVNIHHIISIAHILENDQVITLLYQKGIEDGIGIEKAPILDKIEDDLLEVNLPDSSYIVDCLEKSGLFYADMLTLEKRRHYSPNKKDYAKLRRFAHTPCRRAIVEDNMHERIYMEF